jgi:hypothetical protein
MSTPAWTVRDNGPIQKLEENLWEVESRITIVPMKRRMSVIRLTDGSLVVHSAICLAEEAQAELDRFGPVRFIVVPNAFHRMDAPAYAARYPDAKVLCPDPVRGAVARRVRVDGSLDDLPADPTLSHGALAGSSIQENVLTVRSGGRTTLVFNDTVMNLPPLPGFKGWIYGAIGSTGAPKVTPLMRLVSVRDRAALRANLETLAALPDLYRVLPGHGARVEGTSEAPAMMRTVAAGL